MTLIELLNIIDSGMVEELTIYFYGRKTVLKVLDLPKDYQKLSAFNCPIARMWNSESGNGISVLLADKSYGTPIEVDKPNCVTCDHFGKCEGCEKKEEE